MNARLLLALLAALLVWPVDAKGAPTDENRKAAEQEAHALLQRWLDAQNNGKFEDYLQLYAPKFHGVRRSGTRTVRLNLAGWRKDRERMFGKKVLVKASDLFVTVGPKTIQLQFKQSWSSGSYSDVGLKAMSLTQIAAGQWRILSEEMLESEIIDEPRWLDETARGEFAFLERGAVVLASGGHLCKDSWSGLNARDEDQITYNLASCSVPADRVPKALQAWLGAKVVLQGRSAKPLEAKVVSFQVMRSRYPSSYEDRDEASDGWESTPEVLVGVLDRTPQADHLWARLASLPAVDAAKPSAIPTSKTLWRKLDSLVGEDLSEAGEATIFAVPASAGGGEIVAAWNNPTCGEEGVRFSAIAARPSPQGALKLLGNELVWRSPMAVVDVDGDGAAEIFVAQPGNGQTVAREVVVLRRRPNGEYVRTGRLVLRTTGPNPC